jgi:tRNA A37 threonylcarbamoyladenosine dehydratase
MSTMETPGADLDRRFGGIARLYGDAARARFAGTHVCVVGIGGVGTWAAEALARSAIGALTLIDLDMIAESNVNRQIHALDDTFGRAKVSEMANRIRAINPACRVTEIEDFVTPENVGQLLAGGFDAVIDAVDETRAKVALITHCRSQDIPIVTAGAAGGRIDPTCCVVSDLAQTTRDALLSRVRKQLRQAHGFPRDPKRKFGIAAVYSSEQLRPGDSCDAGGGRLSCTGYGSSVCVTATFGFAAAASVLRSLAGL